MVLRTVLTENGLVEGARGGNPQITVFRGIPFAKPPVGELRWRAPQPAEDWEGVYQAKEFKPNPMQGHGFPAGKRFTQDIVNVDPCSEDCLYLNVWTPAESTDEKLPVMVWIFGGGFMNGSPFNSRFDGEGFAQQNVILVTVAYRVGLLGFLAHSELSAEDERGSSGNYGMLDQIAALRWVQRNIEAFGGDSENVTIFGQSAGGRAVTMLCVAPETRGLFRRAIMQSGGMVFGMSVGDLNEKLPEVLEKVDLEKLLGVKTIAEARALPAELIAGVSREKLQYAGAKEFVVVDGSHFPRDMSAAAMLGEQHDIDYLCGADYEENPKIFKCALSWGEAQIALGRRPAYVYRFSRRLPGDDRGAFHGAEHQYVFQTLHRGWRPFTGGDWELSKIVSTYWANFAKTGDPNGPGLPVWQPYTAEGRRFQNLDVGVCSLEKPRNVEPVTRESFPYPEELA